MKKAFFYFFSFNFAVGSHQLIHTEHKFLKNHKSDTHTNHTHDRGRRGCKAETLT